MKLNIVPARQGVQWVRSGIRTFLRQPLALTGLFFLYAAAAMVLSLIPVIGSVLALTIVPGATLGLMAATKEAEKGRFPMPTLLVSAFRAGRQQVRAMLVLGLIYAAACTAIVALVPLLIDVPAPAADATGRSALSPEFQLSLLLAMALYLPVALMFWHAPALVHWHGIAPVKSLFFSTVACLRNGKALTLYGLTWMLVFFSASLIVGLIALLTGSPQAGAAILMPMGLILTAMFTTSLYFTFRDSFAPQNSGSEPAATPPPGESS
jgi:hypothetical protein